MTTADPLDSGHDRSAVGAWYASARAALDRPLTAYYLLLGASALLLTIGLIMVLSASSVYSYEHNDGNSYAIVTRQLVWVVIAIPCAFVASRMPIGVVRGLAWPALVVSIVLLALVRVPGLGRTVNGNTNWLGVGPFTIQPAEIAKLAIVLWAAHIYARKDKRLTNLHHVLMPVLPGIGVVIVLVMLGRDLGTALVLFAILLAVLWVVGAPGRLFAMMLSTIGVLAFYLATTSQHRLDRLMTFTDPFKDYHYAGWQPAHGLYALASGGIFGQGIGASREKWGTLPEAHTDFIFAVLGEELGLVGTLLVIALFLTIAYAAVRVATRTTEPFVRYLTFGIVVWLLGQMIINVGMVLALLPVIGIPLPLVSYGGSALVPSLVALGLLIGFARREPEAARALAQRRRLRSAGLSAGPRPN
ncbi:putative lipid II flippase FtsW [Nocardioides sp. YIM 152315]|uniref:putative lipid II flippase FtsW n=1 Tax=Nocardioides sp. YIM 152315 TaxID=3031760 RepID=UPI0023DB9815|nr:putative lipid II flippase FtsW [Nocardioides sp. YIM 152315]MDF1603072.1 putative lipid II flippase FtsW [Nocardioides sp. YIM 152315]